MRNLLDLTGGYSGQKGDRVDHAPVEGTLYDIILIGEKLSRVYAYEVPDALAQFKALLATDGQLHLHMPSLEWASREVRAGRLEAHVLAHLYGVDDQPRRCSLTLLALRDLCEKAGLVVVRAETEAYVVGTTATNEEKHGDRHYLVAVKPAEEWRGWISA